jgi:pimeloyl-ACP methyl ester carboxylesterase
MGAAILLESLKHEDRFCAVAAESSFADLRSGVYSRVSGLVRAGPWLGQTLLRLPIECGLLYARWRYGADLASVSPRNAVAGSHIPVLLIHGLKDTNIVPDNSRAIWTARPSGTQLWEVPGAEHCGARAAAPAEFDRRILGWFNDHGPAFNVPSFRVCWSLKERPSC